MSTRKELGKKYAKAITGVMNSQVAQINAAQELNAVLGERITLEVRERQAILDKHEDMEKWIYHLEEVNAAGLPKQALEWSRPECLKAYAGKVKPARAKKKAPAKAVKK